MKIKINNMKEIIEGLDKLKKVIPASNKEVNVKITKNCYVIADKEEGLSLIGTDLEQSLLIKIDAEVEEEGKALISIDDFKMLSKLKNQTGCILTESGITTDKRSMDFSAIYGGSIDEFPVPLFKDNADILAFRTTQKNLLDKFRIKYASSTESTRPAFNSILIKGNKIITSDTCRLVNKNADFIESNYNEKMLIPLLSVKNIEKIFNKKSEQLINSYFRANGKVGFLIMESENITCMTRLCGEKFPDFDRVIPDDSEIVTKVKVNSADMLEELLFIQEFHKDLPKIQLHINSNITLTKNIGEKQCKTKVDFISKTHDVNIDMLFNHDFIIDTLKHNPDEEVYFKFYGDERPMIIETQDGIDLVLPIVDKKD